MPYYEGIGLIAEKNAVVIDVGAKCTKVGYAGDHAPRAVVDTPEQIHTSDSDHLYDVLVDFVHELYFQHLLVNPKDRRVVLVDHLLGTIRLKKVLSEVLFRHFEVLSVLYAPAPLLPLFTLGTTTGLVLDMGHSEASLIPVLEGVPVLKAWQALPLAGQALDAELKKCLTEKATVKDCNGEERKLADLDLSLSPTLIEDIKVRLCFVASLERGQQIQAIRKDASSVSGLSSFLKKTVPSIEYPHPDGAHLIQVEGSIRESIAEVLFEQDEDRLSVATMLLDALLACPLDARRTLASNIVIIGGTALLRGFKARLFQELKQLLQKEERYNETLKFEELKLHVIPVQANLALWTGASLFGGTEAINTRSYTRDVYTKDKTGAVPDWSDFRFNTLFSVEDAIKQG